MGHDVFISYSHNDKAVADAACATLERAGIRCWIAPRDIRPGAEWGGSIIDAINNCHAMVLIFSASANDSPQIRREVERAVNKEVPILPFRIQDVQPTQSLEYFIGTLHWLDALTPPMEAHLQHLTGTIKALLTVPTLDPDAAEAAATNAAKQRAAAAYPPPPAQTVTSHKTNWLMWSAIFVGMTGVILVAILWIVMSARNPHTEVAAGPSAAPPRATAPVVPPAPPTRTAHVANVPHAPPVPGGPQKWSGLSYSGGSPIPGVFQMSLTIADDGTITGSSTDIAISMSSPMRNAIIAGHIDGQKVTFTKNYGGSDVTEYSGVIDAQRSTMSGTWKRGAENGTFNANVEGGDSEGGDEPDLPGTP